MKPRQGDYTVTHNTYSLPIPDGEPRQLAANWLLLGVSSLVLSGLFAILIVLSRTPYVQDLIPWVDFFHTALVVHVDLSVLVWFLAFAGVFWSLNTAARGTNLAKLALMLCMIGTAVIATAPFMGAGNPIMSNYIPVLLDPVFLAGLLIFGLGFALLILRGLLMPAPVGVWMNGVAALRFGINTSVIAAALAVMAFIWSYFGIPEFTTGKEYFEVLFWGGGHVLQFMHTQLVLVAWLWLASATGAEPRISPRAVLFLFAWGLVSVFFAPLIYLAHDVTSAEHRVLFTWLMAFGGSLASLPIGLAVVLALAAARWRGMSASGHAERAALAFSILLFGLGGIIGFMITGSNVTVPAHYHGNITAITLAFMGLTYHLLPRLGYREVSGRVAVIQPYVYGMGQLLHVTGLAWSGGHGVQRKTAGAAQGLQSVQEIAGMALMGLGGLIAIIGGVLFLIVVFRAIMPQFGSVQPAPSRPAL